MEEIESSGLPEHSTESKWRTLTVHSMGASSDKRAPMWFVREMESKVRRMSIVCKEWEMLDRSM